MVNKVTDQDIQPRDEYKSGFIAEKMFHEILRDRFKIPEVSPKEFEEQESEAEKGKKYTRPVFAKTTEEQDRNGMGDYVFYLPNKGWVKVDLGTDLSASGIEEKKVKDKKNGLEPLFLSYTQIEEASLGGEVALNRIYDNLENLLKDVLTE